MKKTFVSMLAAAAVVGGADAASAQLPTTPLSVEVRGGLALPQGDLDEFFGLADLGSGVTLGANAQFQVSNAIGVYAGYSFNQFSVEEFEDADVTDQGFDAGVMLSLPFAASLSPYVKGGIALHNLSVTEGGEDEDFDGEELGFQVGAGLNFPLGNRLSVTPGVTFTQYGFEDAEVDVSHLTVDVGLKFRI